MKTKTKRPLSLIHTISAIFITITVFVAVISFTSIKSIERIGNNFEALSTQALPQALNNAKLTQSILEQAKLLSYGMQATSTSELLSIEGSVAQVIETNQELLNDSRRLVFGENALAQHQSLEEQIGRLNQSSMAILESKAALLEMQQQISDEVTGFRYGLSSIGPEMNRISSFLSVDNPVSTDAANRFIASASSMESTFLMLMMQTDLEKAELEYKEMRNRVAGINLAYDDFLEWHPDVVEFASLITPYEMVKKGFKEQGVLKQILNKLQHSELLQEKVSNAVTAANQTVTLLDEISTRAQVDITERAMVVDSVMESAKYTLVVVGLVIGCIVLTCWLGLRAWINRGLQGITHSLKALTNYDYSLTAKLQGPKELQILSSNLNTVIETTRDSISSVTRNCETLYQSAEVSHQAAEQSKSTLKTQNHSLDSMVATVTQLEASIKEIATVTNGSYSESVTASEASSRGVSVVESNNVSLEKLEKTLNTNEQSMLELDNRVKQIREMVDLISGIAENTNLLALNAAIEAARAGEQGRGFAVVADEVRQLASGTSQQTSNIRQRMSELIAAAEKSREAVADSRKEMSNALASSHEVKQTFEGIEDAVNHIRARIEQITVATEQQERATADVSRAIAHISEQGEDTRLQLDSMVESSEQVADIAGHQQAMLHKYVV
ncbi:methyl-accepting chemotaxis protein [Vibrio paucivorans]